MTSIIFLSAYIICVTISGTQIYKITMLCYCPYCINELPETLINGVTFCEKCSRILTSNKLDELLSAFKLLKKGKYKNYDQLKFDLQLSTEDFNFVVNCFELDEMTLDEFTKKAKALHIT